MKSKTVVIIGGGTGGHITPGIALYEELREQNIRALFLTGVKDARFSSLASVDPMDLLQYSAPKVTKNPLKIPFFAAAFFVAYKKARKLYREYEVDAVIGMGGYTSAPALLAAMRSDIPLYLCEQNTVPGRVTRLFEKKSRRIFVTFEESREYLKMKDLMVHAGNPIRKDLLARVGKEEAKKAFHLEHSGSIIFAIGGSQGALKINELILGLKKKFSGQFKNVGIIWSTGDYSYAAYKDKVQNELEGGSIYLSPFIARVGLAYRACDIAISRSGAGVMMELAAMGLPSIQIPFPHAAMNHQDKNADAFVKGGAALKIANEDATPEKVAPLLFDLLGNPRALKKMSERAYAMAKIDASAIIAGHIIKDLG